MVILRMSKLVGLIAENDSDIDVIRVLIQKLAPRKTFRTRKFIGHGCGKIISKCHEWARNLELLGCKYLILVQDLDTKTLSELRSELQRALAPCPIARNIIVIPIVEIEAWLLADNVAIQRALKLPLQLK